MSSAARRSTISTSCNEFELLDFDQILSELCDLEQQLKQQSGLSDTRAVEEFLLSPSPSFRKQSSESAFIFKDYTQQLSSGSPGRTRRDNTCNAPEEESPDPVLPADVQTELNLALLELSALIGSGFDPDGNEEPDSDGDCRQDQASRDRDDVAASRDRDDAAVNSGPVQSDRLQRDRNGTNNNSVHTSSRSAESETRAPRAVLNSGTPTSNWQEHHSDGCQNDSAYDDNVSLPSSESHISVATSSRSSGSSINNGVTGLQSESDESQRGRDAAKVQLDKINLLNLNKTLVRVYSPEGKSENAAVTDQTTVSEVIDKLLANNRVEPNLSWSLVEQLPGLCMERLLEDNERLTEIMSSWTKESENRLLLTERVDKYDIFVYPEKYLTALEDRNMKYDDSERQILIKDFLEYNCRLPEFDGMLYIKLEGKKTWKKLYFILRASGIYYNPKGKSKSLIDLVCLQRLDSVDVFTGVGWKKKHKAPTDFGFALKHLQIQKKAPKYIKYFCADDLDSMWLWVNSIRLAKCGQQLFTNFVQQQNCVNQFFGEDPVARSKQTALIQEKISEIFSQQVESAPSFGSAAELFPAPLQTFRADSPDTSLSRLLASCLDDTRPSPPAKRFGSPVRVTAESSKLAVIQTRSPIKVAPPKKPMTESASVHHLPPPPLVPEYDADIRSDPDLAHPPGHGTLSGSVDQLQSVGYPAYGRGTSQQISTVVQASGNIRKWTSSQKQHAVIKRTPSIGHRDVEDPPLGSTSPKPMSSPKPCCSPKPTTYITTLVLPSSLPPVRRKFPSSGSFSDCDDGRTSLTPHSSPKPKPPLPPKRRDIFIQSVNVPGDNSPIRGHLLSAGNLTLPRKQPVRIGRMSSDFSSQDSSQLPPCSAATFTMKSSPSFESWQNSNFIKDLERVILQKQVQSTTGRLARDVSRRAYDDDDDDDFYHQPSTPPTALLGRLRKTNRPPPPPRRNNETQLTYK